MAYSKRNSPYKKSWIKQADPAMVLAFAKSIAWDLRNRWQDVLFHDRPNVTHIYREDNQVADLIFCNIFAFTQSAYIYIL
jgi:hypothetical protein